MGLNELDIFHVVNCGAFLLLSRNKSLLSRGRGGAQGRAEHKITVSATPVQNLNLKMSAISNAIISREFSQCLKEVSQRALGNYGKILEA